MSALAMRNTISYDSRDSFETSCLRQKKGVSAIGVYASADQLTLRHESYHVDGLSIGIASRDIGQVVVDLNEGCRNLVFKSVDLDLKSDRSAQARSCRITRKYIDEEPRPHVRSHQ